MGHKEYINPTMKNQDFQSQGSGTSAMSTKYHISNHRSKDHQKQARNKYNINLKPGRI